MKRVGEKTECKQRISATIASSVNFSLSLFIKKNHYY